MNEHNKKFRQSIKWELLNSAYGQVIQFILSIILARLLSPADFGIVALAYVVIRIAEIFADVGFSSALIQETNISDKAFSTVFWINVGMGVFFVALFQLIANPIGEFYGEVKVSSIIRVLGVVFLIDALGQVQSTQLRKNLNFKLINLINALAQTFSGIIAIILAFAGWGVWSLVIQTIIASLVNVVFLWFFGSWRPNFEFNFNEAKRLFQFGSYVFFSQLIGRISLRIDTILVGKFFSPSTLGLYNRADSLLALIRRYSSTSIIKVAFPYFSKVKDDDIFFINSYNRITGVIYYLGFLITGFLSFTGKELIILVYGQKWMMAGEYFEILCFIIFFLPISTLMHNVLLSKGLSKFTFHMSLLFFVIRLAFSFLTIILFENIFYFLYSQVIISVLINIVYMFLISKRTSIKLSYQLNQFVVFVTVFVLSWLISWVVFFRVNAIESMYKAMFMGMLFCVLYAIFNLIVNRPTSNDLYNQIKLILGKNA